MALYKRCANSGPVPYPDGSHRLLTDEVVSGDEWIPLLALNFVELVDGDPGKYLPPTPIKALDKKPEPKAKKKPVSDILRAARAAEANSSIAKGDTILGAAQAAQRIGTTSGDMAGRPVKELDAKTTDRIGDQRMDNKETGRLDEHPDAPKDPVDIGSSNRRRRSS